MRFLIGCLFSIFLLSLFEIASFSCGSPPTSAEDKPIPTTGVRIPVSYVNVPYPKQIYGVCLLYIGKNQARVLLPGMVDTLNVPEMTELSARWNEQYSSSNQTWCLKSKTIQAIDGLTFTIP